MENKKPIYKKWWFWVLLLIAIPAMVGIVQGVNESRQTTSDKTEVEDSETSEPVNEEEKEDEPEENPEEETVFERTDFYEGEQTIEIHPGIVWSENSYFNIVYDALDEIKEIFDENDEAETVLVLIKADFMDSKGNEEEGFAITFRYSRDTFNELNYDNFKQMSLGEEWRILNESDGYFIHQAIRNNLKSKYTDNLR